MRVLLAQINPTVGDLKGNAGKIIKILTNLESDIYVFPELCITGYIPQDLLLRSRFITQNLDILRWIIEKSGSKALVLGFVDRAGGKLYNGAAIVQKGKLTGIYHKQCIPNYHIFDEKRWFSAGESSITFNIHNRSIGVNICEDIWYKEPCINQKNVGAEMIINISASPYRRGKIEKIEEVIMERHKEIALPIVYVNQVGAQDGIVFYGHSMFVNDRKIVACKDFEECVKIINIS